MKIWSALSFSMYSFLFIAVGIIHANAEPEIAIADGLDILQEDFILFDDPYANEDIFSDWVLGVDSALGSDEPGEVVEELVQPPTDDRFDVTFEVTVSTSNDDMGEVTFDVEFKDVEVTFEIGDDPSAGRFGTGGLWVGLGYEADIAVSPQGDGEDVEFNDKQGVLRLGSVGGDVIVTGIPSLALTAFNVATGTSLPDLSLFSTYSEEIEIGVRGALGLADNVDVEIEMK